MRTVPFMRVFEGVALALGIEVSAFSAAQKARALAAFNRQIITPWKFDFWPELMLAEQRAFRPYWDEETQFSAGDIVYFEDDQLYYQANSAPFNPQDGESPAVYPTKWTEISVFRRYVALDQVGETPIDEVEGLYRYDPRLRNATPGRITHKMTGDGAVPTSSCDQLVWVNFRIRPSQFSLTAYVEEQTYAAGTIVLSGQECYKAKLAVPVEGEITDPVYWELQPFPAIFEQYMVRATVAALLQADGQAREARAEQAEADLKLSEAHDQQFASQGQFDTAQVRTY